MYAWVNGNILPAAEASISIKDLGLLRGYAVFDYLRIYNHRPFRLQDHVARLLASCGEMRLPVTLGQADFAGIISKLHARTPEPHTAIRIVVTGGVGADSMTIGNPTVIVAEEQAPVYPERMYHQGMTLITHQYKREAAATKSTNYLTALRLQPDMKGSGADDVLFCENNQVLELTRNNFFCFTGDELITPKDNILHGVTRKVIMELAAERFKVFERDVTLTEVLEADEAFLCGTGKKVMPVVRIDGKTIGDGMKGEKTSWVMARYDEVVLRETSQ